MEGSPDPDKSAAQPDGALEQFEILGKIAEGGMGAVYKARHTGLDKLVALKVLNSAWKDDTALLRFQNEARTLSRLNNPFIADVYDFGISKNGEPFMAIEFIDGITLQELIDSRQRLPVEEAIPIWLEICAALSHAHSRGVVHRDIKPGNVMLTVSEDGERSVKVVDFGIAKSWSDDEGNLTQTGGMIGSPLFMSPEQSLGAPVTPKSDMYSLGCLMFFTVVGNPPFEGDTILSTVLMHRQSPPPSICKIVPDIPERVVALINRLLEKDSSKRPESMKLVIVELENVLEEIFQDEPADDSSEDQRETISLKEIASNLEKSKTNRLPIVLMVLAGIVLSAGIVFGVAQNLQNKTNTEVIKTSPAAFALIENGDKTRDPSESVKRMLAEGRVEYLLNADFQKEGWQWSNDKMAVFQESRKVAQTIDLTNTSQFTDAGLKHLKGQPLQVLKLNGTGVVNLAGFPPCHETLRKLELKHTRITDKALRKLEEYPYLTSLHLDGTSVSIDAIKRLLDRVAISDLRIHLLKEPSAEIIAELYERYPGCHVQPGKHGSKLDKDTNVSMRLLADGKNAEALNLWKKWEGKLDTIPDTRKRIAAKVYEMEATCYTSMNKSKQAEQALRKAVSLAEKYGDKRDRITAYGRLFEHCANNRQTKEAIAIGRKLLALKKSDNQTMTYDTVVTQNQLARLLMLSGSYEEASKLIEQTLAELKANASLKELDEERAKGENRWSSTFHDVTEKHNEAWAAAYISLGDCQLQLNRFEESRASLEKAIEILQPLTNNSSKRCLLMAYVTMTQLCVKTEKLNEALDNNTRILALAQTLNSGHQLKVLYLVQRMNLLRDLGRLPEAKSLEAQINELKVAYRDKARKSESRKKNAEEGKPPAQAATNTTTQKHKR